MAIEITEIEEWLKTEEGKKWLELQKKPLLEKRDELLQEVAGLKSRLAADSEKGNALEAKLNSCLDNLRKNLCYGAFDDELQYNAKVISDNDLRDFVLSKIEKLAEADGGLVADVNDDGEFTYAAANGKGFADYYREWTQTEGANSFLQKKREIPHGTPPPDASSNPVRNFKEMSAQEIASGLKSKDFRNELQSQLKQKRG